MHLLLIRHGQSFVNLEEWDQGYVDAGLTALGQRQAAAMARWLENNTRLEALYTSTMARTLETTAYVAAACRLTARPDDRLREFGNCYIDGTPVPPEAMPIKYPEWWGTTRPYTPLGERMESWVLFRLRVGAFLEDVVSQHPNGEPDATVAVICHGGVIDAAFEYAFNVGPYRRVEIWTHNTGIVHWEYRSESGREPWRLHAHDLVQHLITDQGEWLGSRSVLRDAGLDSAVRRASPVPPSE